MTPDDILAALDPEQREVAEALAGPVCVLAGAGTGKTRAITHRLAYGVLSGQWSARSVLAVTFTARAAGEMRGRLRELGVGGVQARTFHSAALRQLTYFWPRVVGGDLPRISDRKVPLIAQAAGRLRLPQSPTALRDLAAEIEWAKVTRTPPEDYGVAAAAARRAGPAGLDLATVGRIYDGYEDVKRAGGLIDFEDVLLLTVAALEDRPDVAEEVRSVYRHVTVDEYQDVNPLQQRLLELWLGDRTDLCVVGDASQTIYSFTGASPRYLLDFPKRWGGARVVRLVRDYRSTPQVVALANGVLANARGASAGARLELVAQRPAGADPTFTAYDDEPAEASGVAARISTLLGAGVPASEMAVLYRVNAQSEIYEAALTDAAIPYVLRGAERFFERPEVREAVILMRGAARAGESSGQLRDDVAAVLSGAGWDAESPPAGGASRERWESLAALVRLAEDVGRAQPSAGLRELIAEIEERTAAQHAPTVEGVTLASLHAAKGLEWDAVFLVGLVEGTMPIVHADTPEAVEEERRLLYVGVTRAREHVALSWAASRAPGGSRSRRPSRFLDGLRPDSDVSSSTARQPRTRGPARRADVRCYSCGAALVTGTDRKRGRCDNCPPAYDEELYERLRAWRLERSRADKVPAYVVLTDATLEAVATRRPAQPGVLATIPGIGAAKLGRYGEAILELVAGRAVSVTDGLNVTET